jgi:hypothetical protein
MSEQQTGGISANIPGRVKKRRNSDELPKFIQYTLDEISQDIPEIREFMHNPAQLKRKNIVDVLNLIYTDFENRRYEIHQYINTAGADDVFIFKLRS